MTSESLFANWQVLLICFLMIVGAVIDGWKLKVPNWLTFNMILSGWFYWGVVSWRQGSGTDVGMSVLGTFVAGGLLIFPYIIGGMGAGDVKMYAGFGAWMVPIQWFGLEHLLWAFAVSAVVGGVMAAVMIWWKRSLFLNLENVKEILADWQTSGSVGEISAKAKKRKGSLMLLPYGIPLTIGSLGYIGYLACTLSSMSPLAVVAMVGGLS